MRSIKKKPSLTIHSVSLASDTEKILAQLSSDASDFIGRSISASAIMRALLRYVDQQGSPTADAVFTLIEKELRRGVMWGKK